MAAGAAELEGAAAAGPGPAAAGLKAAGQCRTRGRARRCSALADLVLVGTGVAVAVDDLLLNLAAGPTRQGHRAGDMVAKPLKEERLVQLQGNAKTAEGARHRLDASSYISARARRYLAAAQRLISGHASKNRTSGFQERRPERVLRGKSERRNVYDFIDKDKERSTLYWLYDVGANSGGVRWQPP